MSGSELDRWLAARAADGMVFPPRDEAELERWLALAGSDPKLPEGFLERLVQRLDLERDLGPGLARVLERADPLRAEAGRAPLGLTGRVRRAVAVERALDRALDAVPAPSAPTDLAARVLRGVAPKRSPGFVSGTAPRPAPRRRVTRRVLLALAALALVGVGLRFVAQPPADSKSPVEVAQAADADPELLAVLDVLESWEDITDAELLLGDWDELDGLLAEWDVDAGVEGR